MKKVNDSNEFLINILKTMVVAVVGFIIIRELIRLVVGG